LRRIIWRPADECNLAPGTLARVQVVLDIEHGIAATNALLALAVFALCVEKLLTEGIEVGFLGGLFNDNLFPVVADLVDDPLDILAELQLVECADALGRYRNTNVVLVHVYIIGSPPRNVQQGKARAVQAKAMDGQRASCHVVWQAVRTQIEPVVIESVAVYIVCKGRRIYHVVLCVGRGG
jgi:hypothetical protein